MKKYIYILPLVLVSCTVTTHKKAHYQQVSNLSSVEQMVSGKWNNQDFTLNFQPEEVSESWAIEDDKIIVKTQETLVTYKLIRVDSQYMDLDTGENKLVHLAKME